MLGFSMAVSSMEEGEKAVFTIPPELAGTKSGCPASIPGNIPQNQALRFDIELISLVNITDIFGDEGVLKKIVKEGIGYCHPCDLDEVLVNYNACIEDGVSVSKSEGIEFNLVEGFFCPAFAHAVKTMTEGEEAILIVKPEYGFGEQGRPSIGNEAAVPPDATIYVYIQLISWKTVSNIGEDEKILKKILRRGKGKGPESQSVVRGRLIGKLQDGAVFYKKGHEGDEPFEIMIDEEQVSACLEEVILTMREGEIASFTFPPQHLPDQLVVVPPGSSVTYEIELLSVVNDKDPWRMSRAESIETAARKEKEGDKLFSSSKFLSAYRRYYKAKWIIMPHIKLGATDGEISEEETDGELGEEETDEEEMDEKIKQMFLSFAFKAAECAIQLQWYTRAKRSYDEILKYDPGNAKAQQLAEQPFPEDSLGIDPAAVYRGLWRILIEVTKMHFMEMMEPSIPKAIPLSASIRKLKQTRRKPKGPIVVPSIKGPDARAASDVNGSRATTNNENQNSGTSTPPGRPTVLASDGVLHYDGTELKSEQGSK